MVSWKGLSSCKGYSALTTGRIQQYILEHGGLHIEKNIICCLWKYLEVRGNKDDLDDKKIVRPNSVVEGSYH